MCGIAGFVSVEQSSCGRDVLVRMMDAIQHRGPDESGVFHDDRVFLGHRRLSIVDLASGQQPMPNEDRSVWITYNGEIFNHSDLRPELEEAGHRYRSHCDTETILHSYEQFGPAALDRFRGMFSFAIWDQNSKRLFCARDRLGKKPFYYYWNGKLLAFASEIKALLQHPAISPAFDDSLLPEFLAFGYISDERTLFSGIRKLMPGHYLTLDLSGQTPSLQVRRYWDVPAAPPEPSRSDESWIRECRDRLEETVRMRLMSDVPLGMFLSGGLDSSAIAAVMRRMVSGPIQTFSVGYSEAQYSELGYAAQVAQAIGTDHHEVRMSRQDFFDNLPRLIWHEDEPIAWPSSVSLYFVSRLAAQRVKVVLTGEGSDELFAGYERYRWNAINMQAASVYKFVPGFLRRSLRNFLAATPLLPAAPRRKLLHSFLGRDLTLESLYLDNFYSGFSLAERSRLLRNPAATAYRSYRSYWDDRAGRPILDRMLYSDQKTYLVELLMKQDQMSMACSIESRVPLLDHEFVEFAMRVPARMKIRGSEQKYILKKAVEDLLPHEIVYRKKMGFPTPIRAWLQDAEAAPLLAGLSSPKSFLAAYLDTNEIARLTARHQSGAEDATERLWRLLNLQVWGDMFFIGKSIPELISAPA